MAEYGEFQIMAQAAEVTLGQSMAVAKGHSYVWVCPRSMLGLSGNMAFTELQLSRAKVGDLSLRRRLHLTASHVLSEFESIFARLRGLFKICQSHRDLSKSTKVTMFKPFFYWGKCDYSMTGGGSVICFLATAGSRGRRKGAVVLQGSWS